MLQQKKDAFWHEVRSTIFFIIFIFIVRTYFFGLYQVPTPSMENTMLVGERFFADKLTVWFKDPVRGDIISVNQPTYHYSENKFKNYWERYVGISLGLNFKINWGPTNWTKRVIGAPGDELRGVLEHGKPVIYIKKAHTADFVKLDEPYLNSYPVVATFNSNRNEPLTYRTWDPSKPLNQQPFYQFEASELEMGKLYINGDRPIKSAGTPSISYINHANQPWNKSEIVNGIGILDEFEIKLGSDEYWLMGDNRLASHDSRAWGPVKKQLIHGKIKFRIFSLDNDCSWWIFELIKHPIRFYHQIRWSRCMEFVK